MKVRCKTEKYEQRESIGRGREKGGREKTEKKLEIKTQ
jgi:hypothetical protein